MKPKPNEVYRRQGFYFVIHFVKKGWVYMLRRRPKQHPYDGMLIRVTEGVWRKAMAGAKPLNGK